ncbi:MAG TPA: type II secretion system protein [Candidatus Paceibacterota bacterium]|nr:type II secretion system protein [Candidatus Paceibacterota bacterium]
MKKNLKGFTLVEMLIVISIIAILSGAILAGMGSSRSKARNAKVISNVNTLQLIMENAYTDGSYPTGPDDVNISASDRIKATSIIGDKSVVNYCPAASINGKITSYRVQGILEKGTDADDLLKSSLTSAGTAPCGCDKAANPPQFCVGE